MKVHQDITKQLTAMRNRLIKERDEIQVEIDRLSIALGIRELEDDEVSDQQSEQSEPVPHHRPFTNSVTREKVRDAVLALYRNPPTPAESEPLISGYYTIRHIAEIIGVHKSSDNLRTYLNEMVEKGLVERKPYKRGNQFRYVKAQVTVDKVFVNDKQIYPNTGPVAGTGVIGMTTSKEINAMLRALPSHFKVDRTGGNHVRITNTANGKRAVISSTPSDNGAYHQVARQLRDIGAVIK